MKVNIIKAHHEYPLGWVDVDEDRARYLISVGVAEPVVIADVVYVKHDPVIFVDEPEVAQRAIDYFEKENKIHAAKEKKENKTGNVPTAKKKK